MNPILKYLSGDPCRMGIILEKRDENETVPADLDIFFDVPYTGKDANPLHADIYRQKNRNQLPVIIMIHGGGLYLGKTRSSKPIGEFYARHGYLTAIISYRLLQETDGISIISDIIAGYNYVYEHISEYGGDPEKVFVTGESAGAFLAIMATAASGSQKLATTLELEPPKLKISALAFFSGMIYTNRFDPMGLVYRHDLYGNKARSKDFLKLIDPEESEIADNLPPLMLTSSKGDFLKNYTLRYEKFLRLYGKNPLLLYYPDKDLLHAFPIVSFSRKESKEVHAEVIDFFNQHGGLSSAV